MYYAESLLGDGMTEEATFTFTDGAVSPSGLNVKGSLPKSGSMKITTEGKIALAITNGELCITKDYDASEIETTEEFESCELPTGTSTTGLLASLARINDFATEVNACATSGTCALGTPFAIEVAPGNIQNFSVISDVNNKVTLIMDRNIGNLVAWGTSQSNGPITAIEYLENQTSGWTNILGFNYTYSDSLYSDIERKNIKARLLTGEEATNILGCVVSSMGKCVSWSYDNLFGPPYGYWVSSAYANDSESALGINDVGSLDVNSFNDNATFGVRPVIEISK